MRKQRQLTDVEKELFDKRAADPAKRRSYPSPVPMQPPVGYKKQPSMMDNMRALVRSEHLRQFAQSQGHETFEEANDFDVEDDPFPRSPYEIAEGATPVSVLKQRLLKAQRDLAAATRSGSDTAPGATPSPDQGGGEEAVSAPGERSEPKPKAKAKKSVDEAPPAP